MASEITVEAPYALRQTSRYPAPLAHENFHTRDTCQSTASSASTECRDSIGKINRDGLRLPRSSTGSLLGMARLNLDNDARNSGSESGYAGVAELSGLSEVSSDNMHHVDKKIIDDIKDSAHLMPGMPTESALPQIVIPCVVLSMASAVASVITHGWDGEVPFWLPLLYPCILVLGAFGDYLERRVFDFRLATGFIQNTLHQLDRDIVGIQTRVKSLRGQSESDADERTESMNDDGGAHSGSYSESTTVADEGAGPSSRVREELPSWWETSVESIPEGRTPRAPPPPPPTIPSPPLPAGKAMSRVASLGSAGSPDEAVYPYQRPSFVLPARTASHHVSKTELRILGPSKSQDEAGGAEVGAEVQAMRAQLAREDSMDERRRRRRRGSDVVRVKAQGTAESRFYHENFFVMIAHLTASLAVPAIMDAYAGCYEQSSVVMICSFISPLSALIVYPPKSRGLWVWMGLYAMVNAASLLFQVYHTFSVADNNGRNWGLKFYDGQVPTYLWERYLFLAMSIIGVSVILLFTVHLALSSSHSAVRANQELLCSILPRMVVNALVCSATVAWQEQEELRRSQRTFWDRVKQVVGLDPDALSRQRHMYNHRFLFERSKRQITSQSHKQVVIIVIDIMSFTEMCTRVNAIDVMIFLDDFFSAIDKYALQRQIIKLRTIGDGYLAAAGLSTATELSKLQDSDTQSEVRATLFGLDVIRTARHIRSPDKLNKRVQVRIGMHVGQVYSGVVGVTHPQYEVFGDVVSVAMKLEASALANTIHMSTLMRDNLEENWSGLFEFQDAPDLELGNPELGTERPMGTCFIKHSNRQRKTVQVVSRMLEETHSKYEGRFNPYKQKLRDYSRRLKEEQDKLAQASIEMEREVSLDVGGNEEAALQVAAQFLEHGSTSFMTTRSSMSSAQEEIRGVQSF